MNKKDPRWNAGRGIDVPDRLDSAAAVRPLVTIRRDVPQGVALLIRACEAA